MKLDRTRPRNPIWNSYRTKDNRWFWLAHLQPDLGWPDFCQAIGKPEMAGDPRYNSIEGGEEHSEELVRIIDKVIATKTMKEWENCFREYNVIYGLVQSPMEVVRDPQAIANDFFAEVEHPDAGKLKLVTTPAKFYQNPASVRTLAPNWDKTPRKSS